MFTIIDNILNSITMYRVVLYGLIFLSLVSIVFSFFGLVPFSPLSLIFSLLIFNISCFATNYVFRIIFKAITNFESSIITAFILFFLFSPPASLFEVGVCFLSGILAMASKYVLAIDKKHIFNPAAAAAFIVGLFGYYGVVWWASNSSFTIFTCIIGFLIVRKIKRFSMVFTFFVVSFISIAFFNFTVAQKLGELLWEVILYWPVIFFATVMLVEPQTAPLTRKMQIIYAGIVGILFGSRFSIGPLFATPELALLIGNIFSYVVSPKDKRLLILKEKTQLSKNVYEFVFSLNKKLTYLAGQYLEFTLPVGLIVDSRGNRRYFTIASSPTKEDLEIGTKFYDKPSWFKKSLLSMRVGDSVFASQLSGEFVLPEDRNKKLVFIAGGIGITPFKSMIEYMIDTKQKRDVVLFYSNKTTDEIVYKDILDKAKRELGIKTIYVFSEADPQDIQGKNFINGELIKREVPDYNQRLFYISGSRFMVLAFENILRKIKISKGNIKTDFFPGYA